MDVEFELFSTYVISTDAQFDVAGELAFEGFFVLSLQFLHVFCNMLAEDVFAVNGSVEFLLLSVVAREALDGVRDVESTINGAFHGTEDTGSSGGAGQSNVQVATESSWSVIQWFDEVFVSGDVGASAVEAVQPEFLENTTGNQKTGGVSCSVVGQTDLDAVFRQFMGVRGADNAVTFDASVSDLTGDVAVAQTHNQTVLGSVILILILEDKTFASLVVSSALATPLELDLVPLEVLLVLHDFDETHFYFVSVKTKLGIEKRIVENYFEMELKVKNFRRGIFFLDLKNLR
jgi:hypothetical protein